MGFTPGTEVTKTRDAQTLFSRVLQQSRRGRQRETRDNGPVVEMCVRDNWDHRREGSMKEMLFRGGQTKRHGHLARF